VYPTTGDGVLALAAAGTPKMPIAAASRLPPTAARRVRLRNVFSSRGRICGDPRTHAAMSLRAQLRYRLSFSRRDL
jgi:hypothetical protein